jgi:ABC-type transporter Mla subunit MlaD
MNEQAIRFRIGIFVLAGLLALGVLILLFGGRPYFFTPSTNYTIHFDNAQGVASGTPVKRSGVKIGEVRKVTLDDGNGEVEVLIQIEDGFKLRKSDRPTIVSTVLGGDATIAFLPPADKKDVDMTPVEPGSVLDGYVQADASRLLQKTSDVIQPAEDALKEIKKTLEKLAPAIDKLAPAIDKLAPAIDKVDKLLPVVQSAFEKVDRAVPVMQAAVEKFDKLAPSVQSAVEKVDKLVPVVQSAFEKVDKLAPSVQSAVEKIDKLAPVVQSTFEKADKLVPEIEQTFKEINKNTLPDIRKSLDEFQVLARSWNKVGERADLFIRTNEDKLTKVIDRTDEVLKRVNEVLADENQKNLRDILKNVRISSDRFDSISKNADELLKDGKGTLKSINDSLMKVDNVLTDLQKATKPLAERGDRMVKNLDEVTDKLNRTLTDVRDIMQAVTRGNGTVQRLLSDPSLYNNLNEASLSLSKLMPRFDHIMRDFEIFADKLARHPELLGVRGAVAPGNGLKEAPAPYKVAPYP